MAAAMAGEFTAMKLLGALLYQCDDEHQLRSRIHDFT
jgi:hypothetical protein